MEEQKAALPDDRKRVLEKITEYETLGGEYFFRDVEDDPESRTLMPEDVDYLREKPISKIKQLIAVITEEFARLIFTRKFDMEIKGEDKLAELRGGAVFTSNHFSVFENLAVLNASKKAKGRHKLFKVVREGNFFMTGVIGFLLKNCRTLPLSSNMHTMMQLDCAIGKILEKDDFVLIYPEQSMWWNYKKPRPYRIGAFRYAAKYNVPIVPCFVTLSEKHNDKTGRTDIKYTLHILDLIYPEKELTVRENADKMLEKNAAQTKAKYEEIYGVPLTYLCDDKETV